MRETGGYMGMSCRHDVFEMPGIQISSNFSFRHDIEAWISAFKQPNSEVLRSTSMIDLVGSCTDFALLAHRLSSPNLSPTEQCDTRYRMLKRNTRLWCESASIEE